MLGGGGHASVLVELLLSQGREILAIVSPDDISERHIFDGVRHLKNDNDVLQFNPELVLLVNGIGPMPGSLLRNQLSDNFSKLGYQFESVISPNAIVSPSAILSAGVQIFHAAVIQVGVSIGENTIINTGAIIEHDCQIGKDNHIAPRATLCGQVLTEKNVYVGAAATIIQNIKIEQGSVVGAGTTITHDLAYEHIAYACRPILRKKVK